MRVAPKQSIALSVLLILLAVEGSAQTTQFVRGDANADSRINITDAVVILGYLFTGGVEPACLDAADFNDDAATALNITDAILVLNYLFTGGASPAAPAPSGPAYSVDDCGVDPTGDNLGCARFAPCPPLPGSDVPPPPALDPHADLTSAASITISGRAPGAILVDVGGGNLSISATVTNGAFEVEIPLQPNVLNRLFFVSVAQGGERSAPTPDNVTQDETPPSLFVDFPASGATLTNPTVTVAGRVSDLLSGYRGLEVTVNDAPANVAIGIGTNGTFEKAQVPLALGANTITVRATDAAGNPSTRTLLLTRIAPTGQRLESVSGDAQTAPTHDLLPQPLVVQVLRPDNTPVASKVVLFRVTRSDGVLSASPGGATTRFLEVQTAADGRARAFLRLGTDAGCGNNRVETSSADVSGVVFFCATATPSPPSQINIGSGNNQRAESGVPAPEPLRAWVSDGCNGVGGVPVTFRVLRGGARVNGASQATIATEPTGHAQVRLTLGPAEGNNIIEATFLDNPGPPAVFQAFGLVRDAAIPTTFSGVVLDNADQPIEGATCIFEIAAFEGQVQKTNRDGEFSFESDGSGPASLTVDGLTATHVGGDPGRGVPVGSFPYLQYDFVLVPNAANSLHTPIRLPYLNPNNARVYDGTRDVELTVEGIEGLKMLIRAGSMRRFDGSRPTPANPAIVALNQVHFDDVPMPMPDGAAPPFAWTLQPARSTYNPPIQVTYPNMTGLAPGSIGYFLTFNHDTNRFEIFSSGHVTEDGSAMLSDPGSGISVAGWGCNCPPYSVTGGCENDPCEESKKFLNDKCDAQRGSGAGALSCQLACLANDACNPDSPPWVQCTINDYANNRRNGNEGPVEDFCELIPSWVPTINVGPFWFDSGDICFALDGTAHLFGELIPSWTRKCNEVSDGEHNAFLFGTLVPCLLTNGDLGLPFRVIGAAAVPIFANITREIIQARCGGGGGGGGSGAGIAMPPPPSRDELFAQELEDASLLQVSTTAGFFLGVGGQFQLKVTRRAGGADVSSAASGTQYFAAIAALDGRTRDMVTITPDGLMRILETPSPFTAVPFKLLVVVRNGDDTGIGQFAITDVDTDGDLVVDSFERGLGLNPNVLDPSGSDADQDGIEFLDEVLLRTHPGVADTDGDGLSDGEEVAIGSEPTDPLSTSPSFAQPPTLILVAGRGGGVEPVPPDTMPVVTVGGQTVTADKDGFFTIGNIAAADQFGPGGPGTVPDFLSDDYLQAFATFTRNGKRYYATSACFQLLQGQTFQVSDFTISENPPRSIDSVRVALDLSTLNALGQTTQARVIATLSDGTVEDITTSEECITYRSSNPRIAAIDGTGLLTARGGGLAFITAVAQGTTAVTRVLIVPGDPLTTVTGTTALADGTPLSGVTVSIRGQTAAGTSGADGSFFLQRVATTIGQSLSVFGQRRLGSDLQVGVAAGVVPVPAGITNVGLLTLGPVAFRDLDMDGASDEVEVILGLDPTDPDTDNDGILDGNEDADADGLSDVGEFILGTDPQIADSDGDGARDGNEDTDLDGIPDGEETRLGADGVLTNPLLGDSDADGMSDGYESRFHLNPLDPSDAVLDSDADGLTNLQESALDTDPFNPDRVPPMVETVDPTGGESGVPINSGIVVFFAEPMRPESLNAQTIRLAAGGPDVSGTVQVSGDRRSATFRPTSNLSTLTTYTLRIGGVRDAAGNPMAAEFSSTFATSSQTDFVRPQVAAFNPGSSAAGVAVNALIAVRFNERVDPATITEVTFSVRENKGFQTLQGSRSVDASGLVASFMPSAPLAVGTSHTIIVTAGIFDLSGNALVGASSSFTVGFASETSPPQVIGVDPADGAGAVATNVHVNIRLDGPVDATSVDAGSVAVTLGEVLKVPGTLTLQDGNRRIRFVPGAALAASQLHRVRVTGLRDIAGTVQAGLFESSFTTAAAADTTRPSLISSNPASGAQGVDRGVEVALEFSEPLNPQSVNTANIVILDNSTGFQLDATVALDAARRVIQVAPLAPLAPFRVYLVRADVLDPSGNIDTLGSISFTTGSVVDATPPSLAQVSPPDGATGVPLNARVNVSFSEPLDPLSLGAFRLRRGAVDVAGSVVLSTDRVLLTFTPGAALQVGAHTITLTGLRDVAGNAITGTSTFSTSGIANLALAPGVVAAASSQFSVSYPPSSSIDGNFATSWFTQCGDAANLGTSPFFEAILPGDARLDQIRMFGNRSNPNGFDFIAGRFQAFNAAGTEIYSSGNVDLPLPNRDLVLAAGGVADVRRVRFTSTSDESCEPGFAELELIGEYDVAALGGYQDAVRPSVQFTPAPDATSVPLNQAVTLTFTEVIDPTTLVEGDTVYFRHMPDFSGVSIIIATTVVSARTVTTLTPDQPLLPETVYRIDVDSGVRDLAGNQLLGGAILFTTASGTADSTRPQIVAVTPADGAGGVPFGQPMVLMVSEPLDASTVNSNNLALLIDGVRRNPSIARSVDNTVLTLTGLNASDAGKRVSVVATSGMRDLSQNALVDFQSDFTLSLDIDGTRPLVAAVRPENGATGVSRGATVVVHFNESIDPSTVAEAVFLSQNGVLAAGSHTLSASARLLEFTPETPWAYGALVQLFITTDLRDAARNRLANDFSSMFMIEADPSASAPQVVDLQSRSSVPRNTTFFARFSEPMDPATITAVSVTARNLSLAGTPEVTITRSVDASSTLLRLDPQVDLTDGHTIQFVFTTALRDVGGTALAANRVFNINAGPALDTQAPVVSSVSPPPGTTGVGNNAEVRLRFPEPMNPLTVDARSITLSDAGGAIAPGTLTLSDSNRLVILVPHSPLADNTVHTVRVQGAADLAGNLVGAFTSTFTTGNAPDMQRPQIVRTTPPTGAVGVPISAILEVEINEPIDPATVTETSFFLSNTKTGVNAAGTRSVDSTRRLLRFAPASPLAVGTRYNLGINTLIQDFSGNALQGTNVSFTTGFTIDAGPPAVVATDPATGRADVPTNVVPQIRMTEAIDPITLLSSNVRLRRTGGADVPSVLSLLDDGARIEVQPLVALDGSTAYTLSMSGLKDLAGNTMAGTTNVAFTTAAGADLLRPEIVHTNPRSGETDVGVNSVVALEFNETLNALSVNSTSVRMTATSTGFQVDVTIALDAARRVIRVTPQGPLDPLRAYNVSADVLDSAGNTDTFSTIQFTTGPLADGMAPSVVFVSPPSGSTGVPLNARINVLFSEPLDPLSLGSFRLRRGAVDVTGSRVLSTDRRLLTFTPSAALQVGAHTITLTGLRDVAGNAITATSTFATSGVENLALAPGVVATASSQFSVSYPPSLSIDGNLATSWFTLCGDAANRGTSPYFEVTLPGDAMVDEIRMFGNRTSSSGFDFIAGNFQAFNAAGTELFASGNTLLPLPDRDVVLSTGSLIDVRRVRFTSTSDESCEPGFAELELIGEYDDPALGGYQDTQRPSVLFTPAQGSTGVPLNQIVTLTFTEVIDLTTLGEGENVFLRRNADFTTVAVAIATATVSARSVTTLTPDQPLLPETVYRIDVDSRVRDLAGNQLLGGAITFTTASGTADSTRPQIVAMTPPDGTSGVPLGQPVVLMASEPLAASTLNANNLAFFIDGIRRNPGITRSIDGTVLTLTGLSTNDHGKQVSVVATSGIQDLSQNPLVDFQSEFTLDPDIDGARPLVAAMRPQNGATGVSPATSIVILFNEGIDPATVSGALYVSQNGALTAGTHTLSASGRLLEFTPQAPWAYNALAQIFLTTDLRDAAGNRMGSDFSGMFMTETDPGASAPQMVDLQPRSSVPRNASFFARFSEPMDGTTITAASVTARNLSLGGTPEVTLTRSLDAASRTLLRLDPQFDLTDGHTIQFTFTTTLRDADGTALASNRVFNATVGSALDAQAPVVSAVSPPAGATGVGNNAEVVLRFSEPMNPLTVDELSVTVSDTGDVIMPSSLTLSESNTVLVLVPHSPLADNSLHTIRVEGAADVAGNAVGVFTSTFTTGAVADTERPRVVRMTPPHGAAGVATNAIFEVEVDKPVNPVSVSVASFLLRLNSNGQVLSGQRTLDSSGRILRFVPDAPLAPGVSHSFLATASIADLAGNALIAATNTFTTGSAADGTPPTVLRRSPAPGDTGVPTNVRLMVQMSEVQAPLSVSSDTVVLTGPSGEVETEIALADANQRIEILPLIPLDRSASYTLSLIGLEDLSGNVLAGTIAGSFTTAPGADFGRPSLVSSTPAHDATGLARNTAVIMTFDEALNPLTVTAQSVQIQGVASTVTLDATRRVITITPQALLAPNAFQTVTADVEDAAGNVDTFSFVRFTTGP